MPQLRQDIVTGHWVAIATERAKRPSSFSRARAEPTTATAQCPFCAGRESMTPPEVMAYRSATSQPNKPGWNVRVVPNLYPAFGPSTGELNLISGGLYPSMNGLGVHEVIISSPDHREDFADLSVDAIAEIIRAYVERYKANAGNPVIKYLLIINNHLKEAGASLEHPHSQVFGIPIVPDAVRDELVGIDRYRSATGACVYCDLVASEIDIGTRVIYENGRFLVFAPFASRTPFESMIIPKWHAPRFEELGRDDQVLLADALKQVTSRISLGLNDPPYNFYIHTSPVGANNQPDYHWHIELLPKLAIAAGFELGTGIMINVVTPESAAEFLRGVDVVGQTWAAGAPRAQ
jgi:UDPglucose--hexose-1-phosphate uridylyltransferase